jgi:beta-lactamase regulating signal transducer with metallopeptidase domain
MTTGWLLLLIDFSLRVTALVVVAWLLAMALRRAAAAIRHVIWTSAIGAAALLPLLSVGLPEWRIPSGTSLTLLSSAITDVAGASAVQRGGQHAEADPSPVPAAAPSTSRVTNDGVDYATAALILWLGGAIAVIGYLLIGVAAASRIGKTTSPAPWTRDGHALADALGISRPVTFAASRACRTPLVSGILRPVVLLPEEAAVWPAERLHVVLLHELAHVRRLDCLTQAVAQLVCAIYWFNPFVWLAARRLRIEREHACDDFVLAMGTRGSDYATHLIEIARSPSPRISLLTAAGVAMAHRSHLEGRLMSILDPAIRRSSSAALRTATVVAVLGLSIPLAAAQPSRLAPPSTARVTQPPGSRVAQPPAVAPPSAARVAPGTGVPNAAAPERAAAQRQPGGAAGRALSAALIEAAEDGDLQSISELLLAGADVNLAVDGDGNPLIAAAARGRLQAARLLLDRGADPNAAVDGDGSPLIAAARGGHVDVATLLLQRGADVNQIVDGDENPLIQASGAGHLDMVKFLVSRGADVNARVLAQSWNRGRAESEWRSALSMARRGGRAEVVAYLLSVGAVD